MDGKDRGRAAVETESAEERKTRKGGQKEDLQLKRTPHSKGEGRGGLTTQGIGHIGE